MCSSGHGFGKVDDVSPYSFWLFMEVSKLIDAEVELAAFLRGQGMGSRIQRMGVRDCSSGWIRIRGLPYGFSSIEVAKLFENFQVTKDDVTMSVHSTGYLAGYCNGEAYVKLRNQETAAQAKKALHMTWVDERYLEIYLMSEEERYMAEAFQVGHRNQMLQHAADCLIRMLHRSPLQWFVALQTSARVGLREMAQRRAVCGGLGRFALAVVAALCLHQSLFVAPRETRPHSRDLSVAQRFAMPAAGPPLPSEPMGVPWSKAGGPVLVELFLDLCCPFSKRMLHTVAGGVAASFEGKVNFVFHSVEASLAVLKLHGPDAFWKYVVALTERQDDFFDDEVFEKSRQQIYKVLPGMGPKARQSKGLMN
eukprot:s1318_g9.t1